MGTTWLLLAVCALACQASADRGGSSLRGALEALQRRQRGRMNGIPVQSDYDTLYELLPSEAYTDYVADVEDLDEEPSSKYIVKLLEENNRRPDSYEYRLVKKKSSYQGNTVPVKESAFRERTHHSDNDRLRDLFMENNETEQKKDKFRDLPENDAEYALLLGQLWTKYKNHKANAVDPAPQGIVKLYKEKIIKKRMPDNWGPIAFKRKRSSDPEAQAVMPEYTTEIKQDVDSPNYYRYDINKITEMNDDKDDSLEEYALSFQPLDNEGLVELADENQPYSYDTVEKRFPVTKRSSGPYEISKQTKRFTVNQNKRDISKRFRSSSGTDPKIINDLSTIFGESNVEVLKSQVKRSSDNEEKSHETLPPNLTTLPHNITHEQQNITITAEESHEIHGHNMHHPGVSGKEIEHTHDQHINTEHEKPIALTKKSIDWSDYFGIDKRKKKSISYNNQAGQDRLRKQYFDTFNKEVIYPLNSFREHNYVKRDFVKSKPNDEMPRFEGNSARVAKNDERRLNNNNDAKLDNIDKKLRNMEGLIVDEALHYSNVDDQLDSKEEQETKEKILSRLAAAYSLEKMRKALKEFKQSIQNQRGVPNIKSPSISLDEAKNKRVAVKKEKVDLDSNDIPSQLHKGQPPFDDFEEEQGAGHYLNGKVEDQFSEGYMGSGRHHSPVMSTIGTTGSCPVLARIMERCHGVDILAGDRGQLFLPLCGLHQICYLCSEAPATTCDLVFLSEADTSCEGDTGCQRAARSALMALRELHDNLADELDGECEASPCLAATMKLNSGWQTAIAR